MPYPGMCSWASIRLMGLNCALLFLKYVTHWPHWFYNYGVLLFFFSCCFTQGFFIFELWLSSKMSSFALSLQFTGVTSMPVNVWAQEEDSCGRSISSPPTCLGWALPVDVTSGFAIEQFSLQGEISSLFLPSKGYLRTASEVIGISPKNFISDLYFF